ncbi:MAG: aldo/keto reductase [Xanthomonadales bacterium]|nr:aldo/keto reductase [Xanthomonadales bacterium]ODU94891.1 MAG: oxidoreductase [Rhodanobacter sp. SCN 66-43]OJY82878.1 MAG: oxidoreductase [Xanthomonadales bacterium 66-474]
MTIPDAGRAGTFRLGGMVPVHRLGYGAMRVTGPGVWGEPADRAACLATLRRVPELGVNFIDTADSYGPAVSEPMLREALHPYPEGLVIATKGGQIRPAPGEWIPLGRPDYLLQQVKMSLRWLGVEQIALWQLHRIDPDVPRDEQFGAIRTMLDEGLIRFAGLSEVTVEEIQMAEKVFPVATVQNRYSATFRRYDDVLDYCETRGIGFIPWYPLSGGVLTQPDSPLAEIARRHQASPTQIAIAWLLKRSPVMIPIPGTSKRAHLEENVAAAGIALTDDEFDALGGLTVRSA